MAENKGIPTEQEIAQLPRLAVVAFAARCARRVQPLFDGGEPERRALQDTIQYAESEGYGKYIPYHDACTAIEATVAAANDNTAANAANDANAYAANAAASAAVNAANAANANANDAAKANDAAREAAHAAIVANKAIGAYAAVQRAIRSDFVRLMEAARRKNWTNATPVPLEFFGEMWPDGEPDWVSNAAQTAERHETKALEVLIDPGDASKEDLAELYFELSKLYKMLGGPGIDFRIIETREPAAVHVC